MVDDPLQASADQTSIKPVDKSVDSAGLQNQSRPPGSSRSDATTSGGEFSDDPKQPTTQAEKREIEKLRTRDREVRTHEAAHKAAAGEFAQGGPSFQYQSGPDGKRYAVGGEVKIDTSKIPDNPEATLQKARTIRRAANAPAQPSGQDRQVAAQPNPKAGAPYGGFVDGYAIAYQLIEGGDQDHAVSSAMPNRAR